MSKARNLSDFISTATVDATEIAANAVTTDKILDANITHAKLHTSMDLSGKTVTFAVNQITGNAIDGGVISNFASTGIDDNSSATAVTILSDGKLGIGTTSPGDKLEVNGVINIRRVGDHPAIRFMEDANTRAYMGSGDWAVNGGAVDDFGISASSTGDLLLGTAAGSERMRITSAGNVGIGTASPTALTNQTYLSIVGTSIGGVSLQSGGSVYGTSAEIVLQGAYGKAAVIDSGTNSIISFRYATAEKMRMDSGGNLLVGKTGNLAGARTLVAGTKSGTNGTNGQLVVLDEQGFGTTDNGGGISFAGNFYNGGQVVFATVQGVKANNTDANNAGALKFTTKAHGANQVEAMRITSTGDVGIGASNPGGSRLYLQDNHTTNVTNAATLIGNTTLTINGNSGEGSDVLRMGPMSNAGAYFIDVSNSGGSAAYPLLLNPISGGKVGIGTMTPSSQLEVSGMTADAYTAGTWNNHSAITIKGENAINNYSSIRFTNTNGGYEHFIGAVQTHSTAADMVFQGYDRAGGSYKEFMRIHDSGAVTKPGQPAFSATGFSSHRYMNSWHNVDLHSWRVVSQSAAGAFNNSNGTFTAPVAGFYWVIYTCMFTNPSTNDFHNLIVKNGAVQIYSNNHSGGGGAQGHSWNDTTVQWGGMLAAGDYLTCRSTGSSSSTCFMYGTGSALYSNFSGYLIG